MGEIATFIIWTILASMVFFWLRLDGELWLIVIISHIATGICVAFTFMEGTNP
jgi:hypothetical protein